MTARLLDMVFDMGIITVRQQTCHSRPIAYWENISGLLTHECEEVEDDDTWGNDVVLDDWNMVEGKRIKVSFNTRNSAVKMMFGWMVEDGVIPSSQSTDGRWAVTSIINGTAELLTRVREIVEEFPGTIQILRSETDLFYEGVF